MDNQDLNTNKPDYEERSSSDLILELALSNECLLGQGIKTFAGKDGYVSGPELCKQNLQIVGVLTSRQLDQLQQSKLAFELEQLARGLARFQLHIDAARMAAEGYKFRIARNMHIPYISNNELRYTRNHLNFPLYQWLPTVVLLPQWLLKRLHMLGYANAVDLWYGMRIYEESFRSFLGDNVFDNLYDILSELVTSDCIMAISLNLENYQAKLKDLSWESRSREVYPDLFSIPEVLMVTEVETSSSGPQGLFVWVERFSETLLSLPPVHQQTGRRLYLQCI